MNNKGVKVLVLLIFIVILGGILFQAYTINFDRRALKLETAKVTDELNLLHEGNERLYRDIEYFSDPHNLEKELRARFNYRLPHERLIIVVPKKTQP